MLGPRDHFEAAARIREQKTRAQLDARFEWDHYAERVHAAAVAFEAARLRAGYQPSNTPAEACEFVDSVNAELERRKGPRP